MLSVISLNSCALLPDASCSTHVTCPVRSLEKNWYMCGRASLEQQLAVGTKHQVPRIPQPARSRHLHVGSLDPLDDQTKLHEDTEIDCVGKSDTPNVRTLHPSSLTVGYGTSNKWKHQLCHLYVHPHPINITPRASIPLLPHQQVFTNRSFDFIVFVSSSC